MWNNLEHHVWKKLKEHELVLDDIYLLAVSGGLDSMVLSHIFKKIKPQAQLILMHFHHGDGENLQYRNQCWDLINRSDGFTLEVGRSKEILRSESDYRQARLQFFEDIKIKYKKSYYLTAHHQDDVLETRLLKLLRGAGPEGLRAFQEWNQLIFRPLFQIKKQQLQQYAQAEKLEWCEDPTNQDSTHLRNWIRNDWLPQLESKSAGAVGKLAHSLQNLIELAVRDHRYETESARYIIKEKNKVIIDKAWLFSFSTKDQLAALIRVLKDSFQCDFSTSQIKEALRRLDKVQNDHIFSVAGINWVLNAQNIVLSYRDTKKVL